MNRELGSRCRVGSRCWVRAHHHLVALLLPRGSWYHDETSVRRFAESNELNAINIHAECNQAFCLCELWRASLFSPPCLRAPQSTTHQASTKHKARSRPSNKQQATHCAAANAIKIVNNNPSIIRENNNIIIESIWCSTSAS